MSLPAQVRDNLVIECKGELYRSSEGKFTETRLHQRVCPALPYPTLPGPALPCPGPRMA